MRPNRRYFASRSACTSRCRTLAQPAVTRMDGPVSIWMKAAPSPLARSRRPTTLAVAAS
ncbi:hypothetical protein MY4038_010227, partial [Beauveria bassiana]